ncbi:MAG: pilus assembly protein N-terminal domain-containing protein [Parvularculaceae bacterium]|nr:pilus assembly protein N-terminal domain-containing protein [Parvularculaceae bacterium]
MRIFAFASAGLAALLAAAPAAADQVWLTMDQVKVYAMKSPASQIIVGNPAIADLKVQDKSRLLLFGKAPGLTNIVFLDAKGDEIETLIVRVRSNNVSMLTLQKGAQRYSLNCTTNCEMTATVGDANGAFTETSTQVEQKGQQARDAAGSAGKQ